MDAAAAAALVQISMAAAAARDAEPESHAHHHLASPVSPASTPIEHHLHYDHSPAAIDSTGMWSPPDHATHLPERRDSTTSTTSSSTGATTHTCPHAGCGKTFSRNAHLTRHLLNHAPTRSYACAQCGRQFFRRDCWREHVRGVHAMVPPPEPVPVVPHPAMPAWAWTPYPSPVASPQMPRVNPVPRTETSAPWAGVVLPRPGVGGSVPPMIAPMMMMPSAPGRECGAVVLPPLAPAAPQHGMPLARLPSLRNAVPLEYAAEDEAAVPGGAPHSLVLSPILVTSSLF
ncbi:hypothetical protein AMAG_13672 [Allomyces macrogynus ATCC 38327]|uniref:C2H2-type domain-containing protein n=1 Tax=Allomyces macrogynus (strain ATCC 38327) TaxID=578462 RepID=A0A0L0T3I2_ALLM3|nr:hypothetical protein AMAG_13672 [Allomyces macrogynus ATCC 38327]|eukprot:KNE69292.1 hypothetical protein AMAG_13672 [Allomyces macrogynus ATCC 38327]